MVRLLNCYDSDMSVSTASSGSATPSKRARVEPSAKASRAALPIYAVRASIARAVRQHDVLVLVGETGSGKSTQVPQYVLESHVAPGGLVGVTQPRRVAAVSLANWVAAERAQCVGETVGYSVRFESVTGDATRIVYATDGMVVREAMHDRRLSRYTCIVLDEAHERTVHTEVLMGIVKMAVNERSGTPSPLKAIVMSATMDVDAFSTYFDGAKVAFIEGRPHNVDLLYLSTPQEDYVRGTIAAIFQIHRDRPPGDILAFLTGQQEIEAVRRKCVERVAAEHRANGHGSNHSVAQLKFCTLYSAMTPGAQMKCFEPAKHGCRKVILATNIAETSLTIAGVRYVVDCGSAKVRLHMHGVDTLVVQTISRAQACQRAGRAGRDGPGTAYRLYTETEYEAMHELPVPEIARCNLSTVALELISMGMHDVAGFDFMTKPAADRLDSAVCQLERLGAVTVQRSSTGASAARPTHCGKTMAKFPLRPEHSKAIVKASEFGCLERMLMIVAMCSQQNIFVNTQHVQFAQQAIDAQSKLHVAEGDHLTLLNVLETYRTMRKRNENVKQWCSQSYVHERSVSMAEKSYEQLRDIAAESGLCTAVCNKSNDLVRRALCHGLVCQSAAMESGSRCDYRLLAAAATGTAGAGRKPADSTARIHPSSALAGSRPTTVVFDELLMLNDRRLHLSNVTVVNEEWLREAAPDGLRLNF